MQAAGEVRFDGQRIDARSTEQIARLPGPFPAKAWYGGSLMSPHEVGVVVVRCGWWRCGSASSVSRIAFVVLALALAIGIAFIAKGYQLLPATMLLSYAVALVGLNLLTGDNGQISLGHGAFYAIGAYTAGILIDRFGVPYPLAIAAAGVASLGVGHASGRPTLKLEGLYLALATFALGVVRPQLLKYRLLEPGTGGVDGIVLPSPRRRSACRSMPTSGSTCSHSRSRRCSSSSPGTSSTAAADGRCGRSETTRWRRRRWASTTPT